MLAAALLAAAMLTIALPGTAPAQSIDDWRSDFIQPPKKKPHRAVVKADQPLPPAQPGPSAKPPATPPPARAITSGPTTSGPTAQPPADAYPLSPPGPQPLPKAAPKAPITGDPTIKPAPLFVAVQKHPQPKFASGTKSPPAPAAPPVSPPPSASPTSPSPPAASPPGPAPLPQSPPTAFPLATPPEPQMPLGLWGPLALLAMLVTGLGARVLWGRGRGATANAPAKRQSLAQEPQAVPVQTPAPPPAQAANGAAIPAPPPVTCGPLKLDFTPTRFTISLTRTELRYHLRVTNRGAEPLGPLTVCGDMLAASDAAPTAIDGPFPPTDSIALAELHALERLSPGQSAEVTGHLLLPLDEIRPLTIGAALLFVALVRLRVEAGPGAPPIADAQTPQAERPSRAARLLAAARFTPLAPNGAQLAADKYQPQAQTALAPIAELPATIACASFLIGEAPAAHASALSPFRLDLGPRIAHDIGQKELQA